MINILHKIFVTRKEPEEFVTRKELEEKELRSADELRKEFRRVSERNSVIEAIEKAAALNRKEVAVDGWLCEELKQELQQKGYKLVEYTYAYNSRTSIEW